ncbi:MAG: tetratricopeptide repeat protein [Kiritimatiellia bacterium]
MARDGGPKDDRQRAQTGGGRPFAPAVYPSNAWIGAILFASSLALYLSSMSWTAFPGWPTRFLLMHLGWDDVPAVLDPVWGAWVRGMARLPWLKVESWAGLSSAVCGAACVGLLGSLTARVRYRGLMGLPPASLARSDRARQLSGVVAGLYLAVSIPFWVSSTRSLPATFHLLLLLGAAYLFSEYQRWGKRWHLAALGWLMGAGTAEFATFLLLGPVAAVVTLREMYLRQAHRDRRAHAALWGGWCAGLGLYALHAGLLYWRGRPTDAFSSPWAAGMAMLQEQFALVVQLRSHAAFPLLAFFCLVPWFLLFVLSRRTPWHYEGDQIAVRWVFAGGLLAVLCNASFAPWHLLGMKYLAVTPYLLLAVCMGYMDGEFWILGGDAKQPGLTWIRKAFRRVSGVFAMVLPLAILAAGALNWRAAEGRSGALLAAAAADVADRLVPGDIVFSAWQLDDALRLEIGRRGLPIDVVSAARTRSPVYLKGLAGKFGENALRQPLAKGNMEEFLENLRRTERYHSRLAIIEMSETFRECGTLVPDRLVYRIQAKDAAPDWAALAVLQKPLWERMERLAAQPIPDANPAKIHRDLLALYASRTANDLGVLQAERGDLDGALESCRAARRIDAGNFSAWLNSAALARLREGPESREFDEQGGDWPRDMGDERWGLGMRYGYVWNAYEWMRRGWVWALSGATAAEERSRRDALPAKIDRERFGQIVDLAYLQWGSPPKTENFYRFALMTQGKEPEALMGLVRLALRGMDGEVAEAYLAEAAAMGVAPGEIALGRAVASFVRGKRKESLAALGELAGQTPGDLRLWMALALFADKRDPMRDQALATLRRNGARSVDAQLALARMHLLRYQWSEAQQALEQAVRLPGADARAWEALADVARIRGNGPLLESSLKTLLARQPNHPLGRLPAVEKFTAYGAWEEAEAELRRALPEGRNPDLLHSLARIMMRRNGDLREARSLLDEALRIQPFNPLFLCTRSELDLKEGRHDDAERRIRHVLAVAPGQLSARLAAGRILAARGEMPEALEHVRILEERRGELSLDQRNGLEELKSKGVLP